MTASQEWVLELRERHEILIEEREAYHTKSGYQVDPEQAVEPAYVVTPTPSQSHNTLSRVALIDHQLRSVYREFLEQACSDEDTYQAQIEQLLRAFRSQIPAHLIADAVGCSVGYARRFIWDEETETVREKTWSQKQRAEQAPPALVNRVRDRDDNECVRCHSSADLIVHHIIPVKQGGKARMENLATLCRNCHRDAHGGAVCTGKVVYSTDEFWEWINR